MIKLITIIALASLLSFCTAVKKTTRIDNEVIGLDFNEIASRYMERPTFAEISTMTDNSKILTLTTNTYGSQQNSVRFTSEGAKGYIALIEKYIKWEKIASKNKDIIKKNIGREKSWGQIADSHLRFDFYSSNKYTHLLIINYCTIGTCTDKIILDKKNAEKLTKLLTSINDPGKIEPKGKYN